MRFLAYDEVDHDQVLQLHMAGFGWPLTEERMRLKVKYDERAPKGFAFYAVNGKKVLGQVFALRIPNKTREGIEDVLGLAEVATAPGEARKGVATALMKRAEEMATEDGLRFSWLLTGRHLVAHALYRKLGYRDMTTFPRGFRHIPKKLEKPRGIELKPYKKTYSKRMTAIHDEYVKGGFGFTERQDDFFEMHIATEQVDKASIKVARRGGEVIGYVVSHSRHGFPVFVEVVAMDESGFKAIVRTVEARHKGSLSMTASLVWTKQRHRFEALGYKINPVHWFALMAKPLERGISEDEMDRLYGFDEGRFVFLSMDGF